MNWPMSSPRNQPDRRPRWPMVLAAGAFAAWVLYLAALAVMHRLG